MGAYIYRKTKRVVYTTNGDFANVAEYVDKPWYDRYEDKWRYSRGAQTKMANALRWQEEGHFHKDGFFVMDDTPGAPIYKYRGAIFWDTMHFYSATDEHGNTVHVADVVPSRVRA